MHVYEYLAIQPHTWKADKTWSKDPPVNFVSIVHSQTHATKTNKQKLISVPLLNFFLSLKTEGFGAIFLSVWCIPPHRVGVLAERVTTSIFNNVPPLLWEHPVSLWLHFTDVVNREITKYDILHVSVCGVEHHAETKIRPKQHCKAISKYLKTSKVSSVPTPFLVEVPVICLSM